MTKKIKFNINNYTKCMCPVCPVEKKSKCIEGKRAGWHETRKAVGTALEQYHMHPEAYDMSSDELKEGSVVSGADLSDFGPKEAIELYCGIGKASCGDLDSETPCLCPTCMVWKNSELKSHHYCTRGKAEEIG